MRKEQEGAMISLETGSIRRYAGWSANVSAGLSIIGGVALILFYALEAPQSIASGGTSPQVFGPLSDYAGLFQFLFMLPLTAALHQLAPAHQRRLSLVAAVCGASGLLTAVIAQALLVARGISFAVNLPIVLVALALIGTWMLPASRLRGRNRTLPRWLPRGGVGTGGAFALRRGRGPPLVL